ncbi:hypothetical protein MHBO_002386 [Bonamia ostreae]|uniref:RING-type domain-containing protein n=1 Tax=Bonamia ostreae TaxID=126728 RepID=A0ABV2AM51_9EUKA
MGLENKMFLENVSPELNCSICHLVLENPPSCKEGHLFCLKCISKWFFEKKINNSKILIEKRILIKSNCPVCKKDLLSSALNKSILAKKMIGRLKSKCKNNFFEYSKLDKECKWTGLYENFSDHDKNCPNRPYKCEKEHIFPFQNLLSHNANCKKTSKPFKEVFKNKIDLIDFSEPFGISNFSFSIAIFVVDKMQRRHIFENEASLCPQSLKWKVERFDKNIFV